MSVRSKLSSWDNHRLRGSFDGSEPIMNKGAGVISPPGSIVRDRREKWDPQSKFLYDNEGTQKFLLANFPRLETDLYDRFQSKRWATVICLYWRCGQCDSEIEFAVGWRKGEVGSVVQQIRRKIKGLRRNGKAYSARPPGRPRKQKQEKT